jgi:RNA polymerase sigma-70 factor (ECF subfamily)
MVTTVDLDLVRLAQRGDRDAFAVLVRTHGDRMFGIARRILRDIDLADDAVQQALVVVWRELPTLRDAERFESWSTRILVRICFVAARTSRRAAVRLVSIDDAIEPSMADTSEAFARRDLLERGFRRLPPDQRAILVLRHYVGLEPAEIADTLGIPPGTVRSRLHYAHREMRAALEADARLAVARGRPA